MRVTWSWTQRFRRSWTYFACEETPYDCATFVLALFRAAVIELVDVHNWPPRDSDAQWHAKIIAIMRNGKLPEGISHDEMDKHIKHLESEKGCARFRPEEVAAAASQKQYPVRPEEAWRLGKTIADSF